MRDTRICECCESPFSVYWKDDELCESCTGPCDVCGSPSVHKEGHLEGDSVGSVYSCFHLNLDLKPFKSWAKSYMAEYKISPSE